jgi:hypothetical protein
VQKTLTRDQLESRKEKAERFVRNVLGDDDRADEIADESLEDYADRRKIQLAGDPRGGHMTVRAMPTSNPRPKKPTSAASTVATNGGTTRVANAMEIQAEAERLNLVNDLQRENERLQDQLDKVADLASAPKDEDSLTEDDLKEKLNEILDVAAPGEADDLEDDEDSDDEED